MSFQQLLQLIRVEVSRDKLEASLHLDRGIDLTELTEVYLASRLDELQLPRCDLRTRLIRAAIAQYSENGGAPTRCIVAQGQAAVDGQDGSLELLPLPLSDASRDGLSDIAPSNGAKIDQRARSRVRWVRAGQPIAKIIPAVPGTDGIDVFNQVIPARPARPFPLRSDDSIVQQGPLLLAARDGVVLHSGHTLRVSRKLVIDGNIDFSTGNVEFPGDIEVLQGVRDCFTLTAHGNIIVRDLVDAANLTAGGSLFLERGVAARELGSLRVGKDLHARYMTNVRAVVGRDVRVDSELTACTLHVGRDLLAPNATIIRGDVSVARHCDIGEVGAVAGSTNAGLTTLRLGQFAVMQTLLPRLVTTASKVRERHDRAGAKLQELRAVRGRMSQNQAELLTQLEFEAQSALTAFKRCVEAAQRLARFLSHHARVHCIIRKTVHPGVNLLAAGWLVEVIRPLSGANIIECDAAGELTMRALGSPTEAAQPLRTHARVLRDQHAVGLDELFAALGVAPIGDARTAA